MGGSEQFLDGTLTEMLAIGNSLSGHCCQIALLYSTLSLVAICVIGLSG